jgi:hypothetical protein
MGKSSKNGMESNYCFKNNPAGAKTKKPPV